MSVTDQVPQDNKQGDRFAAYETLMSHVEALALHGYGHILRAAAEHAADSARADTPALPWICKGPRNLGGRIAALAQEPGSSQVLYAGTANGGLFRTRNAGDTWTPLNGFLEGAANKDIAAPVGAIGICRRQRQTLYVGTGEPRASTNQGFGLFRSDNGGDTFTRVDPPPGTPTPAPKIPSVGFNRILVDPWDANRVWMATDKGLFEIEPTRPAATRIQELSLDTAGLPTATGLNVTDVAADFGKRLDAAKPGTYTFYVGVENAGGQSYVLKATWDTGTRTWTTDAVSGKVWADTNAHDTTKVPSILNAATDTVRGRVRVALCEDQPKHVYTVFATRTAAGGSSHTKVIHSDDSGTTWKATSTTAELCTFPWYCMCLEVHPTNPAVVMFGTNQLYRTTNSGATWPVAIDRKNFRKGKPAEHADQHAIVFDALNPDKVWVGNDGGVSFSPDVGSTWVKRSHGIVAAQFYEFSVHPTFPQIMGGGLQDNGCWVGLGGQTWHPVSYADGGGVAFQPGRTDSIISCHQVWPQNVRFIEEYHPGPKADAVTQPAAPSYDAAIPLPDQPTKPIAGVTNYPFAVAQIRRMTLTGAGNASKILGRVLEGHPTRADRPLIGWSGQLMERKSGSLNTTPPNVQYGVNTNLAMTGNVSAIAFDPARPATIWVGTSTGELHLSTDSGATWLAVTARLGIGAVEIAGIAVHHTNGSVVAISTTAGSDNVLISTNAKAKSGATANSNWKKISNISGTNRDLPASPCTQVVFDTVDPPKEGGKTVFTLFAATIGGVYVTRNAHSRGAAKPKWFAMNANMPVALVRDLDIVNLLKADGTIDRRLLRAATFGRGVFECDLNGTPEASLYIRQTPVEDGRTYAGTQVLGHDPRRHGAAGATTPLAKRAGHDIRIDAPPEVHATSGPVIDGVDFDTTLRSDKLQLGLTNYLYVQAHTRGHATLGDPNAAPPTGIKARPKVYVYAAAAVAPVGPATDHTAPDLPANFWTSFPLTTAPGDTWRKVGEAELTELSAIQPQVARLPWGPPTDLGGHVAILAVVDHPSDPVAAVAGSLPVVVDPDKANALIPSTHRAALRITEAEIGGTGQVYIRDGHDDTGHPGGIAWGGNSPDIMVVHAIPADPNSTFADQTADRSADRIRAGADNHVYVRVHNGGAAVQDITVDLFAVAPAHLGDPTQWVRIAAQQTAPNVPAGQSALAPVFTWAAADVSDPDAPSSVKTWILVALAGADQDDTPDHTAIGSLADFWNGIRSGPDARKIALRGVKFTP